MFFPFFEFLLIPLSLYPIPLHAHLKLAGLKFSPLLSLSLSLSRSVNQWMRNAERTAVVVAYAAPGAVLLLIPSKDS